MFKIYVAGKNLERAQLVINALKKAGHLITYEWVELMNTGPTAEKAAAELEGVRSADILVYLWEPDQESARYEAGMAMGLKKPIVVSGKTDAFFFQLPDIYCVNSDKLIVDKVNEIYSSSLLKS